MSDVYLNFTTAEIGEDDPNEETITTVYGDLPIPRIGDAVFLNLQRWRVVDVLHDYPADAFDAKREVDATGVWVVVSPDNPDSSGQSVEGRVDDASLRKEIKETIRTKSLTEYPSRAGVPEADLFDAIVCDDVSSEAFEDAMQALIDSGEIYRPDHGHVGVV